jgi:ABC-type lipoprotein export system ATPase subunit
MTTPAPIARALAGVTKIYGDGDTQVTALADADLSIYPGEILLIEGPSGSGKTTLISILGLLKPTRGDVFIRGERVTARCASATCRRCAPAPSASCSRASTCSRR